MIVFQCIGMVFKDRGNLTDRDNMSDFLSQYGGDAIYIGERPESFEDNYEWAEATVDSAFNGGRRIEAGSGDIFRLYEAGERVVAVQDDFSEVRVFEHEAFEDYRIHMVSDHLQGYLEDLEMEVGEVKRTEDIREDEVVDVFESILSGSYLPDDGPEWDGDLASYLWENDVGFLPKGDGDVYRLKHSNHVLAVQDDGSVRVGRIESKERGFTLQHSKFLDSKEDLDEFIEDL